MLLSSSRRLHQKSYQFQSLLALLGLLLGDQGDQGGEGGEQGQVPCIEELGRIPEVGLGVEPGEGSGEFIQHGVGAELVQHGGPELS